MSDHSQNAARWGAAQVFLAAIVFSFSGLTSKWMPWSAESLVGARGLVAVLVMGFARRSFRVRLNWPTVLAALSVMLTSLLFMNACKRTSAANAIVLQYAMPVFVILCCALVYKQYPTRLDLCAAALVIVGVCLCFADGFGKGSASLMGNIMALGSAVTYAMVFFMSRLPGCDPFDYTYLGNLFSAVFLISLPFDPKVNADPGPWLVAALMGVLLSAGYLLLSHGMKRTPPVVAAILCNIEPVLNPIWVFLALHEKPGMTAIIGALVVLFTVTAYSILRQRRADEKPGLSAEAS